MNMSDQMEKNWSDSSIIESTKYNPKTKELSVTFLNGTSYMYKDVSVNDFVEFQNSESAGKGFQEIKKKYVAEKIEA